MSLADYAKPVVFVDGRQLAPAEEHNRDNDKVIILNEGLVGFSTLNGFTPGAGEVELTATIQPGLSRDFFPPVSFEFANLCPQVEALGCELALGYGTCPMKIQRFQPRDGDGPGWAMLEEVVL